MIELTTADELSIDKSMETTIKYLATYNPPHYNVLKANEELAEFAEVITKRITKHPDNEKRPKLQDMIDEFGDVMMRSLVVLVKEYAEEYPEEKNILDKAISAVYDRMEHKLKKLRTYALSGRYKGGI